MKDKTTEQKRERRREEDKTRRVEEGVYHKRRGLCAFRFKCLCVGGGMHDMHDRTRQDKAKERKRGRKEEKRTRQEEDKTRREEEGEYQKQ